MNLYWVTTKDHGKDWFVSANNAEEAVTFHAAMNRYEHDLVNSQIVLEIPESINMNIGWPSIKELEACGANILVDKFPRVIEINGKRFYERI